MLNIYDWRGYIADIVDHLAISMSYLIFISSCYVVDTIMAIKIEYGIIKNWMGDPCFPVQFAWDGVKCSNVSGNNTARIISL